MVVEKELIHGINAMDLTQETFIQAYKGIHTLDDVNNVYAWLGSIVYRQGMRIWRHFMRVAM